MSDDTGRIVPGKFGANSNSGNATEFTVSEISGAVKRLVEDSFGNVRVRGEISGYRGPHSSGHAYFGLKDANAKIDAVIWKGAMAKLRFRPEEGMEVVATGKLTTFPGSSKYQIVIDSLEPAGAGALMALLEERKRRLAAEGLFDADRKQLLPYMPRHIGVITSPTGAVIRDILHRVMDRFPCQVTVWPVRVQGETTGVEVSNAVTGFNAFTGDARPDVLIVARGGGSLEDLWGFNDEAIVRAVAASDIPVISAVGHETDWTLIDYAADVRAPTPTGAAEMAVPVKADLEAALSGLGARLAGGVRRGLDRKRQSLISTSRALPNVDAVLAIPRRRFDEASEKLWRALEVSTLKKRQRLSALRLTNAGVRSRISDRRSRAAQLEMRLKNALPRLVVNQRVNLDRALKRLTPANIERRISDRSDRLALLTKQLERAFIQRTERQRNRLDQTAKLLNSLSYTSVLARGFAVVRDKNSQLLASAHSARAAAVLQIEFSDGVVEAQTGSLSAAKRKDANMTPQGNLF
jgi:exodeoxyribonuclease VII large subunit